MRVKCLAQEHNTMSSAGARTRSARSGVERANHKATAPPTLGPIGHFRITSGFVFLASLGAHLFICKNNFHSHESEFNLPVNKN